MRRQRSEPGRRQRVLEDVRHARARRASLTVAALAVVVGATPLRACAEGFLVGVNYPWAAYAHDFGANAWGHDGLATGGWTYQTYRDSRGFVDARPCETRSHSGRASLCITADLSGGDLERSKGEVFIDLRNHLPPGTRTPLDLTGRRVRCRLWLPDGAAGTESARNGVQLFVKSEGFRSRYAPWQNVEPNLEERWVDVDFDLGVPGETPDVDLGFDASTVIAFGIKLAINDQSTARLSGQIHVDDCLLETDPPVSFDFETLEVEQDFLRIARALEPCGRPIVRVFVLGDGRAAPEFTADGDVTGLDDQVVRDLDVLFVAAARADVLVMPVLLDFLWFDAAREENLVQLGGRSAVARDPDKRLHFVDRVVRPLVQRYCHEPRLAMWDVINEPEWAMREVAKDYEVGDPVRTDEMQLLVGAVVNAIHECPLARATVGSARRKWLSYWQGLGLDVYQFHWYDKFATEEPFPWQPYAELGLDRLCIVGEVPTAGTQHHAGSFVEVAQAGGYQGLLLWSSRALDDFSDFASAEASVRSACGVEACPEVGPEGVRCAIEEALGTSACAADVIPTGVSRRAERAAMLVERSATRSGAARRRLLKLAGQSLRKAVRFARRATGRHRLSAACGLVLEARLRGAYTEARALARAGA